MHHIRKMVGMVAPLVRCGIDPNTLGAYRRQDLTVMLPQMNLVGCH